MHVPPYHKKRSWQILLIGIWIGSIIAYIVLVFMYGKMYENVLSEQIQIQTKLNELKRQNETLLQDKENLEEKNRPAILHMSIQFVNDKELKLDRLITHQLEDLIQSELGSIIGQDIDSVAENDQLLTTLIENKTFTIDDLSYQCEVKKITFSKTLKLALFVKMAD